MAAEAGPGVRFSASRVALAAGLHAFGDVTEEAAELLYQDRPLLLARDAQALGLRVVSRDDELEELVARSGARELKNALEWARSRDGPTSVRTATLLAARADAMLADAARRRTLSPEEAAEAAALLREKIRQSVGTRNERLAIQEYEKRTGCQVRLANENMYFLSYPPVPQMKLDTASVSHDPCEGSSLPLSLRQLTVTDYVHLDTQARRATVKARRANKQPISRHDDSDTHHDQDDTSGFFTICGMVDGVADALKIADDGTDEWMLTPVVVEVKNRLHALKDPPPLHDVVQMGVYMKMLGVEDGDLVQYINSGQESGGTPPPISISRVSMNTAPLNGDVPHLNGQEVKHPGCSLWTQLILPRLYALATAINNIRGNEIQRLAFLNGTRLERLAILRRYCDHL